LDIQHLKYFAEVVANKNFTRAAEKLMVTQPMLTRVIKQMEEELGVKLIERTSKSFEMTDVGEMFYHQTVEFLERYHDLYRSVNDMKSMQKGEILLSTPGVLLDIYFSNLLKQFHDKYPNINISIVEEGSKLTAQTVLYDKADLGLVMLPVKSCHRLQKFVITRSVCQLLVSRNHPFAGRDEVHASELKQERIITFSETATLHDAFISYCEREGFEPNLAYKSLMPNFIVEMISHDLCIGVLPLPIINRYMNNDLVTVPLTPIFPWDIAVIHKKNRYQSFATEQMIRFIKDYFNSLPG